MTPQPHMLPSLMFLWCSNRSHLPSVSDRHGTDVQLCPGSHAHAWTARRRGLKEEVKDWTGLGEQPEEVGCGDGRSFCQKAWHAAGGSCLGVPHWRWQWTQTETQGHSSRLALRVLPPTAGHVVLTEVRREGEAPRGCLDHKFTAINSCGTLPPPTPNHHQRCTKYDGHFLSPVWVHGKGSRGKTQVHLK